MKIIQLTGKEISEEDEKFIFEIIRKQANEVRFIKDGQKFNLEKIEDIFPEDYEEVEDDSKI